MNSIELKVEIMRYGETAQKLASAIGISYQSLSNKMREKNSSEFTQSEIKAISTRYNLTPERVQEIFFAQ